jgi:hypothetical protein
MVHSWRAAQFPLGSFWPPRRKTDPPGSGPEINVAEPSWGS